MYRMNSRASGIFEVVWFVLGGLMLVIAVDITLESGIQESWYYFLFSFLALAMYYARRRMRINRH